MVTDFEGCGCIPQPGGKATWEIKDLSHDGAGVGRLNNLVVFAVGAPSKEKVEIKIPK